MNNLYRTELHIPRNSISIAAARKVLRSVSTDLGIAGDIVSHVEIAIEESLTNLFEYAMEKETDRLLRIRFDFDETQIVITFDAPGRPFNFDTLPKYDTGDAIARSDDTGLGLFLLQNIMDVVQWRYLEKQGQQLVIVKKLPSPIAAGRMRSSGFIAGSEQAGSRGAGEVEYRTVRDYNDAFALTGCAYDLYHYDYKDVIYYPNELLARNRNGLMRSWIAAAPDGTVLGHYALMKKHPEDSYAEAGAAFVRPELRKAGVFRELAMRLHADAPSFGLRGIYSHSVTNHVATQKLSGQYGRVTSGISIASTPAIFVEGAKPGDRITTTLNYHQIVDRPARDLHIPKRYRDIVLSTYDLLKLGVTEAAVGRTGKAQGGSDVPFFDTVRDMTWKRAVINARGGDVIVQKLQVFTDVLVENGFVSVLLSIDLEDPSAPALTEAAAGAGYFYSGIFPEGFPDGHDALQMQYLHGVSVDPASILIYQESGKTIFDFIRNEAHGIFTGAAS